MHAAAGTPAHMACGAGGAGGAAMQGLIPHARHHLEAGPVEGQGHGHGGGCGCQVQLGALWALCPVGPPAPPQQGDPPPGPHWHLHACPSGGKGSPTACSRLPDGLGAACVCVCV